MDDFNKDILSNFIVCLIFLPVLLIGGAILVGIVFLLLTAGLPIIAGIFIGYLFYRGVMTIASGFDQRYFND